MNKTFKTAAAAAFALLMGSAVAQADLKFGVAAEPYPPFTSQDASGKWVGWEADLMDAICKEMQEKCEFVGVSWDGIIPALLAKKFDGALVCRWPLELGPRKQWEDPRGKASDCLEMLHRIVDRLYLRNRRLRV